MEKLWEQGSVLTEEEKLQEARVRDSRSVGGSEGRKDKGLQKGCF